MERKIGEIFECNGEWYQCSERGGRSECGFENILCEKIKSVRGECLMSKRKDRKSAIFKKLEKVGEPYKKRISDGTFSTFQRYRVYNSVILPKEPYIYCNFIDSTIEIEIKQTKEDMEDLDKIKVRDYTKVEELNVMEENKLNLKPFDIQKAREGKPVCTRDGRKARIICFDRKDIKPIVALVTFINGTSVIEKAFYYFEDGYHLSKNDNNIYDLMMLPEKKEGWVNVYSNCLGGPYESKEYALKQKMKDCIATVKISWEE